MAVILGPEVEVKIKKKLEGEVFYDGNLPKALREAQEFASQSQSGFVASMPELLRGRVEAPENNDVWRHWFTADSEENVVNTFKGNKVVVVVHGGGILSDPARIDSAYEEGLTPQYAAKLTSKETQELLEGKLPSGSEIQLIPFDEFRKGPKDLGRNYAVVIDFDTAKALDSGVQAVDGLYENPLVIARAGGVEQVKAYLDKARKVYDRNELGNWHPFKNVDPDQAQGRLLFLGGNYYGGLDGDYGLDDNGRFVGVAPEAQLEKEQKKIHRPSLDEIMGVIGKHVGPGHLNEVREELAAKYGE